MLFVIGLMSIFDFTVMYLYTYTNISSYNFLFKHIHLLNLTMHITCLVVPSILYILKFIPKNKVKETLRINKLKPLNFIYIFAILILINPIVLLISYTSSMFFPDISTEILLSTIDMPYILSLLFIGVMPSITEELALRGVLLSNCNDKNNLGYAILNGFFFGLLHGNFSQFFFAFFLGFVFYYLVKITNSIFASVFAHFLLNGSQVTLMYIVYSSPDLLNATKEDIPVAHSTIILSYIIAIIICSLILIPVLKSFIKYNNFGNKSVHSKNH